ncbi:cation diffusion facilitator family transporter [Cellulomonas edaphi]|uniref:Cation diffusion facilitator family transporter n=1 Tax=Cellulomonas edaphi TaxID=3053468 RepID=A0ABT7S3A5_9CELL|nr:cation diffusion facilitator family transporter [Cellulomons edaphi]MDM7830101.1 cation diffusion facilitator family transporter [Cellulomons edaphi]
MGHDHDHAPPGVGEHRARLAVAFGITTAILVAQAVGALITGSLALLVDTAHMLTDAGGLLLALFAASLSMRPANERLTWGYRRSEVLAALAQAAVLLAVGAYVLVEGVQRLFAPPEIASDQLVVFGIIGLVGNVASILVLAAGRSASFNMRAAFLEVVNDALGSLAVIVAAIVIATTGWYQADAVAGLVIGALILPRAFTLMLETSAVLLESTPPGLDLAAVRQHLLGLEHVREVHDVHASLIATGLPVLSAHVVVADECFVEGHAGRVLDQLLVCVATHFDVSVEHSTFQIEPATHRAHEHASHA